MEMNKIEAQQAARPQAFTESERFILDICKGNNARPDWMIPPRWINEALSKQKKLSLKDLTVSTESLVRKGIIRKEFGFCFLTELGYEAISSEA